MNRFILARDVCDCARFMCDQHVRKMIVEEAQMLSTVIRRKLPGYAGEHPGLYKSCYEGHPCTVWAGLNQGNFRVALALWLSMVVEYRHRWSKDHETSVKLSGTFIGATNSNEFNSQLKRESRTPHPQCFGEHVECKTTELWPVDAYRAYYGVKQITFRRPMTWTKRARPDWLALPRIGAGAGAAA